MFAAASEGKVTRHHLRRPDFTTNRCGALTERPFTPLPLAYLTNAPVVDKLNLGEEQVVGPDSSYGIVTHRGGPATRLVDHITIIGRCAK
jgi:hypothetical protein